MHRLSVVSKFGESAVAVVERQQWLDAPGYKLEHGLSLVLTTLGRRGRGLQDLLHGTWLGHPLHPALTDVPLGAWTAAMVLDAADAVSPGRTVGDKRRSWPWESACSAVPVRR